MQDFLCTKWPILTSGIARCKLYCSAQISSISLTASPVIDGSNYNKVQFLYMIYVTSTTCYAEYCIALKPHYPLPSLIRSFFFFKGITYEPESVFTSFRNYTYAHALYQQLTEWGWQNYCHSCCIQCHIKTCFLPYLKIDNKCQSSLLAPLLHPDIASNA